MPVLQDAECDRASIPRALFMDHVFAHLLMTYGAKNMVTEFAACLMVTAKRHRALDLRIEVRRCIAAASRTQNLHATSFWKLESQCMAVAPSFVKDLFQTTSTLELAQCAAFPDLYVAAFGPLKQGVLLHLCKQDL